MIKYFKNVLLFVGVFFPCLGMTQITHELEQQVDGKIIFKKTDNLGVVNSYKLIYTRSSEILDYYFESKTDKLLVTLKSKRNIGNNYITVWLYDLSIKQEKQYQTIDEFCLKFAEIVKMSGGAADYVIIGGEFKKRTFNLLLKGCGDDEFQRIFEFSISPTLEIKENNVLAVDVCNRRTFK